MLIGVLLSYTVLHKGALADLMSFKFAIVLVLPFLLNHAAHAQISEPAFRKLIAIESWSHEELAAFERGDAVARPLETSEKQELATIGVIWLRNLPPVSMRVFRESLSQKDSSAVIAGGRFSQPPRIDDLNDLEVDGDAIEDLRECRVASCDLNLSAEMIKRFQHEINWNSSDASSRANAVMREMLLAQAIAYLNRGDAALGNYDNRRKTVELRASHNSLLSRSTLVLQLAPEFTDYLKQFPAGDLQNVENSIHWSVVDFGLDPSITVSHAAAYTQVSDEIEQHFVSSKQIYSSRYLDSSLTFTLLARVQSDRGIESYIVFLDRSRSDALAGPLGRFARRLVQEESITRIKSVLDRSHLRLLVATRPPSPEPESKESFIDSLFPTHWVLPLIAIVFIAAAALFIRRRRHIH